MFRLVAVLLSLALACNGFESGLKTHPGAPALGRKTFVPAPVSYAAPEYVGPIEAPVFTRRTFELRHLATPEYVEQPRIIEVPANYESIVIHFKTASSPLTVRQSHIAAPIAPVEHSSFQDNPHKLVQEITKPVIQEVREVIQPYRRVTQEVRPVIEEVHTIIHKGERIAPLALKLAAPAYGPGATIVAATKSGFKAAKAA